MITNFLQFVNDVLLDVGEVNRTDLTSTVSRKCVTQINAANRMCSLLHKWWHLTETAAALSWSGDNATLPPHSKLSRVTVGTEELQQFSANRAVNVRRGYTKTGSNVLSMIGVKTAEQPNVRFTYQRLPVVYSLPADVVDLPDYYFDCVRVYAKMLMHQVHTTDQVAHDQCVAEFQQYMHFARTQETYYGQPTYIT
jgi:hypothetical protein